MQARAVELQVHDARWRERRARIIAEAEDAAAEGRRLAAQRRELAAAVDDMQRRGTPASQAAA